MIEILQWEPDQFADDYGHLRCPQYVWRHNDLLWCVTRLADWRPGIVQTHLQLYDLNDVELDWDPEGLLSIYGTPFAQVEVLLPPGSWHTLQPAVYMVEIQL